MSQLKEIDGKYYQNCKVVMLSTKEKANVSICMPPDQSKLSYVYDWSGYGIGYHLYFTSDEEIKEDDYCITEENKIVRFREYKNDESEYKFYVHDSMGFKYYTKSCKKIIATTDNLITVYRFNDDSDKLPQPSQQFIEKYIEEYNKKMLLLMF